VQNHQVDVAVIGAGVIGTALAWQLRRQGASVALVDRGVPGQATSAKTFSWVNASSKVRYHYPEPYFRLNQAAMASYYDFARDLGGLSWFHPTGTVEMALTGADAGKLRQDVDAMKTLGYQASVLTPEELARLAPAFTAPDGAIAAFYPDEAWVDGSRMVDTLLDDFTARRGTVITSDPVVDFTRTADRLVDMRLESGDRVAANTFACTAGAWTPDVAALSGVVVPLVPRDEQAARGLIARVPCTDLSFEHILTTPDLLMRPDGAGQVLITGDCKGFDIGPGASRETLRAAALDLLGRARALAPGLKSSEVTSVDVGIRPLPRDGVSIIGWAPEVENFYTVVTHSGVTLAPHVAALAAREINGELALTELDPFRLTRFA
jgi:glycine/D-amino acid oxidase-like deaminating enzyme